MGFRGGVIYMDVLASSSVREYAPRREKNLCPMFSIEGKTLTKLGFFMLNSATREISSAHEY